MRAGAGGEGLSSHARVHAARPPWRVPEAPLPGGHLKGTSTQRLEQDDEQRQQPRSQQPSSRTGPDVHPGTRRCPAQGTFPWCDNRRDCHSHSDTEEPLGTHMERKKPDPK